MSYDKEINYLKSNKFKKHSRGNSGCYGLNFLGSPSIIQYKDLRSFLSLLLKHIPII